MTLSVGRRLGPYEVLSPLGAGGMGEVYRARDTRLDRTVAVKVLPAHLRQDPERRARFEREARAASALNHPHICTVHDIGQQDGIDYLVMEHLDGETLADRLQKGALPQEQALRIGAQVADALDRAHRAGIVHRDLKPGNVMLTKTGAKLLDFGLARVAEPTGIAGGGLSTFPTQAKPLTEAGSLLGTFQYMAPEQLEGKEADARTDVFALGSVLYEMLTGQRAFEGKSAASLIGSILKDEPKPLSAIQPMTPPALDRLVRRCLAKDPDERWQCAGDLCAELARIAREPEAKTPAFEPRRRWPVFVGLAAACLLLGGLAGSLLARRAPARETTGVAERLSVNLPVGTGLSLSTASGTLALSPDGRQIAFVGFSSGATNLYLRSLGDLEARLVPGTGGATTPFFSPDGQWLGFVAENKLKKVAVSGGQPGVICSAPAARGASWGDDGTILFVPTAFTGLSRVAAEGGTPEAVTRLDPEAGAVGDRWPQALPGGKAALFSRIRSWNDEGRDIAAVSLASREVKVLVKGASFPRYRDGILFYARGGSILARPFDAERLAVSGPEVIVLDDVKMFPRDSGYAFFEVAGSGTAAFVPGYAHAVDRTLVWFDRAGHPQAVAAPPRPYLNPSLAPDGRRIAVVVEGPSHDDIWVGDPQRDSWVRLTSEGDNRFPVWSPDGSRVAFQSVREGVPNVFWAPADGSRTATALTQQQAWYVNPRAFSPDGKELALNAFVAGSSYLDVWTVATAPGSRPKLLFGTPFSDSAGAFSPDGRWLAYSSDESGKNEVYVRSYPDGSKKWLVSRGGGASPRWTAGSREIVYLNGNRLMAAPVPSTERLDNLTPHLLFEAPAGIEAYTSVSASQRWGDVTADGQRFLMVKNPEGHGPQIVVAPGFLDEVRARLRAAGSGHE